MLVRSLVAALLAASLMAGCGVKGDLYLPPEDTEETAE
ncbi:LPS translocon maturation chaperone LptM [Spiribacter halobius]|uniref:Lipopeptide n=1 Tax=Sediminicurvatus halobius TaxID=2182432 RepID=A0A2U2N2W1_9GAMM|nr:lipoprotein [Spiribacter halobius]PWG63413.1 hypothetical protein DEM34_08885 [Spiribacter halobius]UEX78083.1 lipoprotein [Spiribacter halobius]